MKLLWKLLRTHVSAGQIIGFSLANVLGLAVVMTAVVLHGDVLPLFDGRDALAGSSYAVISKPVDTMASALDGDKVFTDDEIDALAAQPAVSGVGRFTPSTYEVYARISLGNGVEMSTDMFFESVPDAFVDVDSEQWRFVEGGKYLPIVLPRNYLDLYNFGFASAKGLPKLSEDVAGVMNISIDIIGRGRRDTYLGFIAGFSNRLNTILVPQSFMDYANSQYGTSPAPSPSRLIVEVANPSDESLALMLEDKGYEVTEGDDSSGRLAFFLRVVAGLVISVGLLISALAFFIFALSIYLLLEKNMSKLENLMLLGYSPHRAAAPYLALTLVLGVLQTGCAVALAMAARVACLDRLSPMFGDLGQGGLAPMVVTAAALLVLQIILYYAVIILKVKRIAR